LFKNRSSGSKTSGADGLAGALGTGFASGADVGVAFAGAIGGDCTSEARDRDRDGVGSAAGVATASGAVSSNGSVVSARAGR
jgi:hypothetical protein